MGKKPSEELLIKLAQQHHGCVVDVAKACKATRQSVYNWMNDHPKFKEQMDKGNDMLVDLAISGLVHHLENNSEKTIHYTLDRLARNKGFGQMIKVQDKSKIDDQLDEMTDEELLNYSKEIDKKIGLND